MNLLKRLLSSIILIPLVFYVVIKGSMIFNFFLIILLSISIYEWINMNKFNIQKIIGVIYLIFSFFTIFLFRNINIDYNIFYFLLVAIICISSDLGGYIFGKILKGPKLISISPNKTYAGVFGAYILSIFFSYLFYKFILHIDDNISQNIFFFMVIISISTISQVGDLILSYFKRIAKIKDTGKIIPGHGGILDRIDGVIFAYPFSYMLILNFLK